jgi:hypothetical protein
MVAHTWNSTFQKADAGGSQFNGSLGYISEIVSLSLSISFEIKLFQCHLRLTETKILYLKSSFGPNSIFTSVKIVM